MHSVRRVSRFLAYSVALAACAGLVGCASDTNLAKVTHTRTVIPAPSDGLNGGGAGQSSRPADPAFAADKLRKVDPCGLLDPKAVNDTAAAGATTSARYGNCSMNFNVGSDLLTLKVDVGITMLSTEIAQASKRISGFKASQGASGTTCENKVVLQEGEASFGLSLELRSPADNRCQLADKATESVLAKLRNNPPQRAAGQAILGTVDPCTVLGEPPIIGALSRPIAGKPFLLHQCSWQRDDKLALKLDFAIATDPAELSAPKPEPVQVADGFTLYKKLSTIRFPICEISWLYRKTEGNKGEVATITINNTPNISQYDACARGIEVAKELRNKLPKG